MSIDKIKTGDDLTQSLDIVSDNISKLKELFPEVLTEGKIDFKVLQDILGNEIEEEDEFYRFTWAGKSQSRREAHKPSTGTLRPCKEESVDWDTTQNLYIEGDNLEVLKLLQKSYSNKVKMIYIDPPYNTGKDFVYKDNYKDNLKNYQQVTGQVDDDGNKMSTNSETDGRYHSNWLNMMYPRLSLSRNLLKEDGVVFISIDDNEKDNLVKLGKEVFGEENYIGAITWIKKRKGSFLSKKLISITEYCLVFSKRKEVTLYGGESDSSESQPLVKRTNSIGILTLDSDIVETKLNPGIYKSGIYGEGSSSIKLQNDILVENGLIRTKFSIEGPFIWGQEYLNNQIENGAKIIINTENFQIRAFKFQDPDSFKGLMSYIDGVSIKGTNEDGYEHLRDILGVEKIMDYPKPVNYLKKLIKSATNFEDNSLIIDFFSGSGSTAEAVIEINLEENKHLRHIQVQLPEPTDEKSEAFKYGYKTIAEIGKERIRRVGKKIKEENPLISENLDTGFKVFKLDSSNIKGWDGLPDNLEKSLFDSQDNIKSDRKEEDVLFEILLKYGLDLTLPIEEKVIEGKKVFNVGYGALFICLGNEITSKVAEGIGQWKETLKPETCRVIFKDGGFTDVEKTNSVQTLKRFGIQEIKSI